MTFSTNMKSVAERLLMAYGQSVSVVRDNIGSYDSSTGTVTDSSDTNYSGYGHPSNYQKQYIDGVLIQQGDVRLTFYSTTAPLVSDIFTVGGKAYTALNVETISAQGSDVYYIVQLRQ